MTSKESLKEVFSGVSSVMFQSTPVVGNDGSTITIDPDLDLPVHVDDLSINEGEPTVNHYKVFGLDTDWVATTEKGDFNVSFLVPSLAEDVLELAYGDDAVAAASSSFDSDSFTGFGVELGTHEVRGSVILLNQAKDRLLILSNVVLWASLAFENGSTDPVGIRFNGTIEANNGPDVIYLKKAAGTAAAGGGGGGGDANAGGGGGG